MGYRTDVLIGICNMGYRSDVLIAVAFKNKDHLDEVWAVYCMDPRVQKHNLAEAWNRADEGDYPVLWYYETSVKWYDGFEDVQGVEHLIDVASDFAEERKHPYASIKYRIGEEINDTETEERDDDPDGDMLSYLFQKCNIERHLTHDF